MKSLKWINTIAFALTLFVNALAEMLPIGGRTTGQISEMYPNLFTPAPATFAIWGAIYLLLTGFIVYQWEVFDHGLHSRKLRENVGLWFAASCGMNIAWIFSWHLNAIALSTICIFALLAALCVLQGRVANAGGSYFQRTMAKAGVDLYYGWILAASISNVSVLLTKAGWNGWGLPADFWTGAAILLGAFLACVTVMDGVNFLAGVAVMWAYAGILFRHLSTRGEAGSYPFVIFAAILGEVMILGAILLPTVLSLWVKRRSAA